MGKLLTWVLLGLVMALQAGCASMGEAGARKPSDAKTKGQLCRFEKGNCQTILIVDELPGGGFVAR